MTQNNNCKLRFFPAQMVRRLIINLISKGPTQYLDFNIPKQVSDFCVTDDLHRCDDEVHWFAENSIAGLAESVPRWLSTTVLRYTTVRFIHAPESRGHRGLYRPSLNR